MASMEDLLATMSSGPKGDELKALHAKLSATLPSPAEAPSGSGQAPYRPIPLVNTGQPLPPPAPASSWNAEADRDLHAAALADRERARRQKHTDVLPAKTTFTQTRDAKAVKGPELATSPPRDAFQSDAFKSLWAQEKREQWSGFGR